MKKIGFVTPWFADNIPGGAEAELRGLVSHLFASGVDLEVLTTCVEQFNSDWNIDYYPEGQDTAAGVPVRRFPVRKRDAHAFNEVNYKLMSGTPISLEEEDIFLKEIVNSPALYEYMDKHRDDYSLFVFIPYMFGTTYYGCRICPEKSILIPCLHDESYAYMNRFKEVFQNLRGMVLHAKPEYELAKSIYDLSKVDAQVLGEGVNTDIYGDAKRFREKYNISEDFIIYAGRKDVGKNVDTLINYFNAFKRVHDGDMKLVLIGGGEIDIPLWADDEIIDLGFVPIQDKYDAYAASLLLCQPSLNESFSIVIMESWLCGRPVLVHGKCPVTKNFASESNGGLYFSDYAEFEGCLSYLISNPEKADTMGSLGRQFVIDNFSWDVIVKKYTEYFEQVSK